jgi:phage tail-like protein
MSVTRSVEPLTEGGRNYHTLEFPGQVSYAHITFESGMTSNIFFWNWMMEGQYHGSTTPLNFSLKQYRHNPDSDSPAFVEVKNWDFLNAFPVKWKVSDLDIENSKKIVIETLEISYDFFMLG